MPQTSEQLTGDWGPFGRPLFADASRNLARVGVVDVGSNSVRLVVFDGAARSPAYFYNEKILCGLGAGLDQSGMLNPEGRQRALAALRRFQVLAEGMGIAPLTAVATAAVREARDGPDFHAQVERETGMKLHVIGGDEEARLSAQGVLLGWPDAQGLVCDIGGSSMELAELAAGEVGRRISSPLGPLKLQPLAHDRKALTAHLTKVVDDLATQMGTRHQRLFLVGGSWRAIARIDMLRRNYPLTVLHEYRMSLADVRATVDFIRDADLAAIGAKTSISMARLALVPLASQVLAAVIKRFGPKEVAISGYGIREGLLWQEMPEELRRRDPLIEACRFAENKDARMPGFGKKLYQFIEPLFPSAGDEQKRLIKAACLLHDVSWRAHPDYRHEVTFDNATRANLGGLTHEDRIFLGLSLLHRYKNNREGSQHAALFRLLKPEDIRRAEILGKAMRFGAMFAIADPTTAGRLSVQPRKKLLDLALTPRGRELYGEVSAARLTSLANSMGLKVSVTSQS